VIAQTHRDQLETVVVTTEKLGRSIRDTTTSIEILTGDALEERSIEDIYEVVRWTPNVGESFGERGFNIRGVDQRGAGDGTGY